MDGQRINVEGQCHTTYLQVYIMLIIFKHRINCKKEEEEVKHSLSWQFLWRGGLNGGRGKNGRLLNVMLCYWLRRLHQPLSFGDFLILPLTLFWYIVFIHTDWIWFWFLDILQRLFNNDYNIWHFQLFGFWSIGFYWYYIHFDNDALQLQRGIWDILITGDTRLLAWFIDSFGGRHCMIHDILTTIRIGFNSFLLGK